MIYTIMWIWRLWVLVLWSWSAIPACVGAGDCSAGDKEALLALKAQVVDTQGALTSWDPNTTCCDWLGISCVSIDSSQNKRVQEVVLPSLKLVGSLPPALGNLSNLQNLNLTHNNFSGPIPEELFSLQQLASLDLSLNFLAGSIPPQLDATLLSLTYLNLSSNKLKGTFPSFENCKSLQVLDLSSNSLVGAISDSLCANGSPMAYLDLSNNNFSGWIPAALGNCSRLRVLKLGSNGLEGEIPLGLTNKPLQTLDLGFNHVGGTIPSTLCTSGSEMTYLDLSGNNFSGHIPSALGNCSQLNELKLGNNFLVGQIPLELTNLSSLSVLDLSLNFLNGHLPAGLQTMQNLKQLLLSNNNLSGEIPKELSSLNSLEVLSIRLNSFQGELSSLDFASLIHLTSLDLSYNRITGPIPPTISNSSSLTYLALAGNSLSGEIPPDLGSLKNLTSLALSGNDLTGNIPQELQGCSQLVTLIVSKNTFTKPIPSQITGFLNLQVFAIGNSNVSGTVPPWLRNCSKMQVLDLSWNHLTGELPLWLGEFEHLIYLDVSNNSFSGVIPPTLANIKSLLHEDTNTSSLQTVASTLFIKRKQNSLALQYNEVSAFPPSLLLSHNKLSGDIPPALGNLKNLVALDLCYNRLIGNIPESLGNASGLESLDLSGNELVGSIPASLVDLNFLSLFNVSYNNLSGDVPHSNQFGSFSYLSYLGNPGLCGGPLGGCPQHVPETRIFSRSRKLSRIALIGISFGSVFAVCMVLAVVLFMVLKKRHMVHQEDDNFKISDSPCRFSEALSLPVEIFPNHDLKQLSVADLLKGTNNFDQSNIIGCGGFGLVYSATLVDGSKVAIKRLTGDCLQMEREFEAEVQTLGKAKHTNLVSLQGYCKLGNDRLLIYSYMENGSLDFWLHEKIDEGFTLDWPMRFKILLGAARGLAYLHQACDPHIVHRDIKSSNILLDEKFEAHLADFGLARLMLPTDTHVTTELVGTLGYIPPEYGQAWIATLRGDVYSFGVVMLEVLTRKRPVDASKAKGMLDLVPWVRKMKIEGQPTEIFDPLLRHKGYEEQMLQVLEIACLCINQNPQKRPSIEDAISWLEEVGSNHQLYK